MKNTTKLITVAFILAMLVSAFVGISASAAENEGALEIKSINISYNDRLELLVAVDIDNAERENVEVTYTINGEKKTATLHPTVTHKVGEELYPVFYAEGIAPKDIADVMTFEAHIKGSDAEGTARSASILDYLYARLYKDGFINKNDGADLKRKNLYINTLNYSASAQDVLINIPAAEKGEATETLVTEYVFVWSDDAKVSVEAGRPFGAFINGTEITPLCDGPVTDWTLTNANDVKFGDAKAGVAFAVTDHTKLVAGVVDGPVTMDYENGASNDYVSSKDGDGKAVTGTWATNTSLSMGLTTENGNTFLQVRNQANSGKTGVTTVNLSNAVQVGNCYTFGARINVKGGTAGYNIAQLKFVNNNGGEALNLFLGYDTVDGKTGVSIKTTGSNSSITAGTKLFDATDKTITTTTKWFDLCIEFYFGGVGTENAENTYIKVYVDNTLVYQGQANWAMGANISYAQIDHISAGKTHNSCYDDIYFTRTDKEYKAD